ncbi:MAG: mechanosensitive ion channel [Thiotrichales bacterium]
MQSLNVSELLGSLQSSLGDLLPNILGTLLILVIGWLVAILVRAGIRGGLRALGLNRRIGDSTASAMDLEGGIAKGAYWLVILITLIAVFNNLKLEMVSEPLNALVNQVFAYLPRLISGGVLILVAWVLATVVRTVTSQGLRRTGLDERLAAQAGMEPIGNNISNILFWLIILLFLPAILGALQLQGLLEPVRGMVDKILAMLPNILAAGVIGFIGWLVARILRDLTSSLLAATRIDSLGTRAGFQATTRPSKLIGLIVFVVVFVPALISALNALKIEAISGPAINMLNKMLDAVPNILAAAAILAVTWFVARFAALTLSLILNGAGMDELPAKLGLSNLSEKYAPSIIVGKLVWFFAMLFATVEAAGMLGFAQIRDVVTLLIEFAGQVLLGAVILAAGFWLSNLAYAAIARISGAQTGAANIARFAILGLVTAMGLRAMGIADEIVNLAFGLTLGAVAVAVALSFGLGGREAAGKQMEHWMKQLRKE